MADTTIIQTRVRGELLAQLAQDIEILSLESTSDALREALALLHRKAIQVQLGASYDDFYGGVPAPVSDVTGSLWDR